MKTKQSLLVILSVATLVFFSGSIITTFGKEQDLEKKMEATIENIVEDIFQVTPFEKAFAAIDAVGLEATFVKGPRKLSDLSGLEIVVYVGIVTESKVKPFGLKKEAIHLQTEKQLQRYGIKVTNNEDLLAHPEKPVLGLHIVINAQIIEGVDIVPICSSVSFTETVMLARSPEKFCVAQTWHKYAIQMGPKMALPEVAITVKDLVQAFINDYLAANPKETGTNSKNHK